MNISTLAAGGYANAAAQTGFCNGGGNGNEGEPPRGPGSGSGSGSPEWAPGPCCKDVPTLACQVARRPSGIVALGAVGASVVEQPYDLEVSERGRDHHRCLALRRFGLVQGRSTLNEFSRAIDVVVEACSAESVHWFFLRMRHEQKKA